MEREELKKLLNREATFLSEIASYKQAASEDRTLGEMIYITLLMYRIKLGTDAKHNPEWFKELGGYRLLKKYNAALEKYKDYASEIGVSDEDLVAKIEAIEI